MSKHCGPNNTTHCVDAKHVLKRLRGVLISLIRGSKVSEGPPVTGQDIERLLQLLLDAGVQFDMPLKV